MAYRRGSIKDRLEWNSVPQESGCRVFTGYLNEDGYGRIRVGRKLELTHRASYAANRGEIPDGQQVLHTCDNPPCINPGHLFLGTQSDNIKDMVSKGRQRGHKGVNHPFAKLDPVKAFEIRWYCAMGRKQREMVAEYGISPALVGVISRCKAWKPECHD